VLLQAPRAKLADAELHFTGGEFDGLKLIGFAVAVSRFRKWAPFACSATVDYITVDLRKSLSSFSP
jgi:hypothetical protein